jgi:hypothetical protein
MAATIKAPIFIVRFNSSFFRSRHNGHSLMKKIYSLLAVLLLASVAQAQAQDKKATTLGQVPATQQPQPTQAEPMLQINQIAQAAIRAGAS